MAENNFITQLHSLLRLPQYLLVFKEDELFFFQIFMIILIELSMIHLFISNPMNVSFHSSFPFRIIDQLSKQCNEIK